MILSVQISLLYASALLFAPPAMMQTPAEIEATSLQGTFLYRPELPAKVKADFEEKLASAREVWKKHPKSVEAWIWYGRRTAYLGYYREAIKIFSLALEQFPKDARLYRHRGHRYLTTRQIKKAVMDFEKAASLVAGQADRVEPDGLPNAQNIPTSTLQTNIWYHLGLAHYVLGDFGKAEDAYRRCLSLSRNDDMWCATAHWLYMTLQRQGKAAEAKKVLKPVRDEMNIIENEGYFQLVKAYKNPALMDRLREMEHQDGVQSATMAYGLANAYYYQGQIAAAKKALEAITQGSAWAAFGFLAAEADLARMNSSPGKSP